MIKKNFFKTNKPPNIANFLKLNWKPKFEPHPCGMHLLVIRLFSWLLSQSTHLFYKNYEIIFLLGFFTLANQNIPYMHNQLWNSNQKHKSTGNTNTLPSLIEPATEFCGLMGMSQCTIQGGRQQRETNHALQAKIFIQY